MRLFKLLCISGFLLCTSHVMAEPAADDAVTHYSQHTHTIESSNLSEQRTVVVQLPKSYQTHPNKRYPVIYRLDGAGNLPLINAVLERLQENDQAPEVIVVAIESTNRLRDFYPTVNKEPQGPVGEGGGAAKFLAFVEQELMPLVNKQYRTHDYRVIAGASAAGVFALYAMQADPELFQAHIAYSPAVWWNYGAPAKSLNTFVTKAKSINSYVYMNIGEEAGIMRERYDDMQQTMQNSKVQNLRFKSDAFAGVSHNLTSAAGAFNAYHGLFLSKHMPLSALGDDISSIDAYYQRLSQQWGEQIAPPERAVRLLGYSLTDNQQFERAIEVFKYNIKNYPKSAYALSALSYGYEMQGNTRQALVQIEAAIAVADDSYPYPDYLKETKKRLQGQL
ncbi:esterase [Pseudoalteromonas shioyasakiensis]|nr:esterase [Pseudoalteromonas shioyasakiensis]